MIPLKTTKFVLTVIWGHALIGPFFSGLAVSILEACLLLTRWRVISLNSEDSANAENQRRTVIHSEWFWMWKQTAQCATDCRRSHTFKWSATLKLPTMCIVQQRKQSLIGPHNPFVVLSSGSRTRRLIEHMIRGALIFLTIALLPPQTQFLVNFVFNKKVPKSQQMM